MEVGSAAVQVLVENLINLLKEEYFLVHELDENVQQLQTTLSLIQEYVNDAADKSITQGAKIWLTKLEDVAFNADNVLDEVSYHLLRKKVKKMKTPTAKYKMLSCFSSCTDISRRHNMALTIKQINTTFDNLNNTATNFGLQRKILDAPAVAHTSTETTSTKNPIFVGRDDDVSNVVDMLTRIPQNKTISVVALVGMGGMGKTTLTQNVFNHERLKTFDKHIWVHVSQTFDPIGLLKKIHSILTSTNGEKVEIKEVIVNKLREILKAKNYLFVLDDVWNEDVSKWEDFMKEMEGVSSTKGNGIIITTRSQNVASNVKPFYLHPVKGLLDEQCWSIIKEKAFDENAEVPPGFEKIGKEIAKRCQGLPLAANVVGGVLYHRKSARDWHSIKENWLSDGEGSENITKILKLSYYHLSSPALKKCFAYCSIFPKGRRIIKEELIELWMAEGFLQPIGRDDMESVGNMFFDVLLQNSLLQATQTSYIGSERCVMHDLVHDLASSVLSNNNADGNTLVRYMFHAKESSRIPPEEVSRNLRTLLLGDGTFVTTFSEFKCLHNLTLDGGDYKELPGSIRYLIHLRNLNISGTSIANIPEWIGELHHLQTLRAVLFHLKKLPNTLKYLINLRHLCLHSETKLLSEIGKLTSLQTLQYFIVGEKKGYQIEELGNLKNLKGTLEIWHLERVCNQEEAMKANILEKSNLSELVLSWGWDNVSERNDESVLEGLQPHANLEMLKIIRFKGKRFPSWCEKLAVRDGLQGSWVPLYNLTKLTLEECSECEEIPMPEHLPSLKSLYLSKLKLNCLPKKLFYNNQNLSTLKIEKCPVLRELPDGLDTLNSLEELSIKECENLKSIGNPSDRRIKYQGILRELRIEGCRELTEFPCEMLELWAPTIKRLDLKGLRRLKNLPMLIDCLAKSSTRLTELRIVGVPNFMASGTIGSLKVLSIDVSVGWSMESSDAIRETVNSILHGCCNSLTHLYLKGIDNWEWLPQPIQHLTTLYSLSLENIGVEELPQWLGTLSSLTFLQLHNCRKLRYLPSVAASFTKLHGLIIEDCPELHIDWKWRNHPNLEINVDGRFL